MHLYHGHACNILNPVPVCIFLHCSFVLLMVCVLLQLVENEEQFQQSLAFPLVEEKALTVNVWVLHCQPPQPHLLVYIEQDCIDCADLLVYTEQDLFYIR